MLSGENGVRWLAGKKRFFGSTSWQCLGLGGAVVSMVTRRAEHRTRKANFIILGVLFFLGLFPAGKLQYRLSPSLYLCLKQSQTQICNLMGSAQFVAL